MRRLGFRRSIVGLLIVGSCVLGLVGEALALPSSITEQPVALRLSVSGHRIREACSGYHEVIAGRSFTVTARAYPPVLSGARFFVEYLSGGVWVPGATYARDFVDGKAVLQLTAAASGRRRVWMQPDAGDPRAETRSPYAYVSYITPSWTRYSDGGVRLTVRKYSQQYRLTCEAAALRMAHNYHDPYTIDGDLQALRVIGIDNRQPRAGRWGNPDKAFVGYYDGRMMRTGYGVHYGPVAAAATRYDACRPAIPLSRPSYADIATHINNGYPVIVWGAHSGVGGINRHTWRAWDGTYVTAWSVEHVWVVVGYRGPAWRPTSFTIHDPSGAAYRTVSLSAFYAFTKYFRTAVVVRG